MKRRVIAALLALVMALSLLPATALAADPQEVYVSQTGDGSAEADGTRENPFSSLNEAYEAITSKGTIILLSDIDETEPVDFDDDKTVTVCSEGEEPCTVTSSYAPEEAEGDHGIVRVTEGTVTLENIVLDAERKGGYVADQESLRCVYLRGGEDNMPELILGAGAVLQNGYAYRAVYNEVTINGQTQMVGSIVPGALGGGIYAEHAKVTMKAGSLLKRNEKMTTAASSVRRSPVNIPDVNTRIHRPDEYVNHAAPPEMIIPINIHMKLFPKSLLVPMPE